VPISAQGGCDAGVNPERQRGLGSSALLVLLRAYQVILSPWLGPACRFEPSCSHYAEAAIERHGALRGCRLAIRRVIRCNPLGGCGYDPVP